MPPAGLQDTVRPGNVTKVIALFGGTNPGLYGYSARTEILGRGRKEQRSVRPGLLKEGYDPKGREYFNHIPPEELQDAILRGLETGRVHADGAVPVAAPVF